MKKKDVKIGGSYWTSVSGELVEVIVTSLAPLDRYETVTRYRVKRVDTGEQLPKTRTAAALRTENRRNF